MGLVQRSSTWIGFSVFLILTCVSACTRSESPNPPSWRAGQTPFTFEVKQVSSFEIAKTDRKTGDSWTAKFQRNSNGDWEISSGPGGAQLLDRKAHTSLIDHLLDTLKTLRISRQAPRGPLESFDLVPPRFALRWSGNELQLGSGTFAAIGSSVYEVEGAALKILDVIDSFQALRQQTWLSPLTSDDIDEVELYRGKKKVFYAQRDGSTWADLQHKPVRPDVGSFIDQITHLRIQEFIDDPSQAERLSSAIQKEPLRRMILKDRHGNATEALLGSEKLDSSQKLYATSSARPKSVFRVFSEGLRFFEPFEKSW